VLTRRNVSLENAGWLTAVMMLGGAAGCLSGGVIVDALLKRSANPKWSRKFVGGGALCFSAMSMLAVPHVESTIAATLLNALAGFFVQISVPTWWTVVSEISGKHGASMWGLMNSMGGFGVIGTTAIVGRYLTSQEALGIPALESWGPVFSGVGSLLLVGAFFWLLVDSTRSIVERT
jgi:MFS family permease